MRRHAGACPSASSLRTATARADRAAAQESRDGSYMQRQRQRRKRSSVCRPQAARIRPTGSAVRGAHAARAPSAGTKTARIWSHHICHSIKPPTRLLLSHEAGPCLHAHTPLTLRRRGCMQVHRLTYSFHSGPLSSSSGGRSGLRAGISSIRGTSVPGGIHSTIGGGGGAGRSRSPSTTSAAAAIGHDAVCARHRHAHSAASSHGGASFGGTAVIKGSEIYCSISDCGCAVSGAPRLHSGGCAAEQAGSLGPATAAAARDGAARRAPSDASVAPEDGIAVVWQRQWQQQMRTVASWSPGASPRSPEAAAEPSSWHHPPTSTSGQLVAAARASLQLGLGKDPERGAVGLCGGLAGQAAPRS